MKYDLPIGTGYKKPNKKETVTKLQKQIIDECYDEYNGPLFFAEHCAWVKCNGLIRYQPYEYQREMFFNMTNCLSNVALWGRQCGKTISTSIFLLWYAMKYDHKDIIMTSYCERSANEILNGIKLLYEYCPDFIKCGVSKLNESEIIFVNGSRIMSRPTTVKAARGTSPAIIYCDEFAFVGPSMSAEKTRLMQEEFYSAISPALSSSHGKLFITSTPITETDVFYELWSGAITKNDSQGIPFPKEYIIEINGELYKDFHLFKTKEEAEQYVQTLDNENVYKIVEREPPGINGFTSQLVKWNRCPLKTKEWAILEEKRIGTSKFAREYNCLKGNNLVKVMDNNGKIIDIPIDMLYNYHME